MHSGHLPYCRMQYACSCIPLCLPWGWGTMVCSAYGDTQSKPGPIFSQCMNKHVRYDKLTYDYHKDSTTTEARGRSPSPMHRLHDQEAWDHDQVA